MQFVLIIICLLIADMKLSLTIKKEKHEFHYKGVIPMLLDLGIENNKNKLLKIPKTSADVPIPKIKYTNIQEGKENKGGVNEPPKTERPNIPPTPQAPSNKKLYESETPK